MFPCSVVCFVLGDLPFSLFPNSLPCRPCLLRVCCSISLIHPRVQQVLHPQPAQDPFELAAPHWTTPRCGGIHPGLNTSVVSCCIITIKNAPEAVFCQINRLNPHAEFASELNFQQIYHLCCKTFNLSRQTRVFCLGACTMINWKEHSKKHND